MRVLVVAIGLAMGLASTPYFDPIGERWPFKPPRESTRTFVDVALLISNFTVSVDMQAVADEIDKRHPDIGFRLAKYMGTRGDAGVARRLLGRGGKAFTGDAIVIVDERGAVRVFDVPEEFTTDVVIERVDQWTTGREIYDVDCARCHGDDGALSDYPDIVRLDGIHKRMDADEVIEATEASGFVLIQNYSDEDRDALAVYVLSLPERATVE